MSDDDYEATFTGVCTCDHDDDAHGWDGCGVEDCDCTAAWED